MKTYHRPTDYFPGRNLEWSGFVIFLIALVLGVPLCCALGYVLRVPAELCLASLVALLVLAIALRAVLKRWQDKRRLRSELLELAIIIFEEKEAHKLTVAQRARLQAKVRQVFAKEQV